jgi:acyl-[acyl-carrier-protein]-phospholipid O-acyltransferase/long-chain-fatty-acid--[acyl-carrier-protein] ligase
VKLSYLASSGYLSSPTQEPGVGLTASILFASLLDIAIDYWWAWGSAVVLLALAIGVFHYFFLVRLPLWLLTHTIYRVRSHGAENVPRTGPALLVSNHVSYIDAIVILAAQRHRVRFLVWAPFLGMPVLRVVLRLARVIPIDSRSGPRAIIQSLRAASDALAQGEVVCIFAEGGITRTGFLLPFTRGFEQIVKRSPVPIVPVCVDHVWGSIFSYQGRSFFWKLPQRVPYVVHVNFGPPLPPTADAFTVRQAIQLLSAESAVRRIPERKPVHRQFVRTAVRHPLRSCIVDSNYKPPMLNYGKTLTAVKILMRRLRPLLADDAMVGIWLPPSAGAAITNIAVACLGKTSVNLNYTSAPGIVQSAIRQCNIRKVLTSRLFTHRVPIDPGPGVDLVYGEDFRKTVGNWEQYRTIAGVWLLPGFVQEYLTMGLGRHSYQDLATIIFSSGSTGDPKGVMLTHGNIAANVESVIQAIDPEPKDRLLGALPFFHSFGYTVTLWVPLQVGASAAYHPLPLQAREIGEMCRKYQCTMFVATPTFLRSYLRRCDAGDFASLRILVCGAEKLPAALAREFKDKFGVLPLEGYGCTELSPVACANVPDWQQGSQRQVGNKPGAIGQPLPGVAARIVHRQTREPLPPGQEGLLLIYGANVMKGYLGRDDLTRQKIHDGWYITGDLARIDEDGFVTITGREERFAKVGGEMVPLEKVEEELHEILGSNEKLCAVTAIPDSKKGERLIVLHLPLAEVTAEELRKRLNERGLPNLYVPGARDFIQVPDLPILGSGKLDLRKCKERAMELAGAGAE